MHRGERTTRTDDDAGLVAELNDLIQLDRDAVQAYTLAIAALADDSLREALIGYRADHERHIRDLGALVAARGGAPAALPHVPTGLVKLTVQAMGIPGGDRGVLLAFEANEGQVREKYARHAATAAAGAHPPEVAEVLRRNARDEERHHAWAVAALEQLGVGPGTAVGAGAGAFAAVHRATADAIEAAGRLGLETLERARRWP